MVKKLYLLFILTLMFFTFTQTKIVSANVLASDDFSYSSNASTSWGYDRVRAGQALSISSVKKTVSVGIIDSGIDGDHLALKSKINRTLSENFCKITNCNPLKNDSNGSHGTHVAGIIGAEDNGQMKGVLDKVDLISYRVIDDSRNVSVEGIAEAIIKAEETGIEVLNISIDVKEVHTYKDMLVNAIKNYSGIIVVCAGNDNSNISGSTRLSTFKSDNIICVGNSNVNDEKSPSSNYNSENVDLFAPGDNIYSTVSDKVASSGYQYKSGTSMAAPYVTATVALLKSINENLSNSEIKRLIIENVDQVSSLSDKCVSGGILNMYKVIDSYVTGHPHEHTYIYAGRNGHKLNCLCGAISTEIVGHTIRRSDIVNNKAMCLGCKQLLDLNFDRALIMYSTLDTLNGNEMSFKLEAITDLIKYDDIAGYKKKKGEKL